MGVGATNQRELSSDAEIYATYADDLVRFATGLVGRSDAQDVVSAAVLRSISSKRWSTVENARAYLYQAVVNQARNEFRDRQRRWAKELRAAVDDRSHMSEYRPDVLEAVKALSLRQRAVVVLSYWEGLPVSEIGPRLGISEGAVRRHLARARSRLRVMLDE